MAEQNKPIDIPKEENKYTEQSKYSISYWLRSTEKKAPETEDPIIWTTTTSPLQDNGIFSMSSNSEGENEESNTEHVTDSETEGTFDPWDEAPRKKSCCRILSRQIEHCSGYNSDTLVTIYEVAYDKANKDLDKLLLKCTTENFNNYMDNLLKNFARNFHWVVFGFWFHGMQDPRKIIVPIYVSDCGHVCAEI